MTEKENDNKAMEEKALLAASRFLEKKGFEILERGYRCDAGNAFIVAWDHGEGLVSFVEVLSDIKAIPDEESLKAGRSSREKVATAFLAERQSLFGRSDFTVRFDVIALAVLSEDRALIRYHTNVLATDDGEGANADGEHTEAMRWAEALNRPDSRGTSLARMLEDEISRKAEAEGWHCEWERYLDEAQLSMAC